MLYLVIDKKAKEIVGTEITAGMRVRVKPDAVDTPEYRAEVLKALASAGYTFVDSKLGNLSSEYPFGSRDERVKHFGIQSTLNSSGDLAWNNFVETS